MPHLTRLGGGALRRAPGGLTLNLALTLTLTLALPLTLPLPLTLALALTLTLQVGDVIHAVDGKNLAGVMLTLTKW